MTLSALLEAIAANPLLRYEYDGAGRGGMAPFQREFHTAQEDSRCQLAATKMGKTYGGAAETWWHLLGCHPFREVAEVPVLGIMLCQDLATGWKELSKVMRELEPPGVLDPSCRYAGLMRGYVGPEGRACIILRNGSTLVGAGCKQDVQALEGWDADFLWVNEVPKKVHFDAAVGRLAKSGGPLWITTTPIGKPTDWLREKVEGIPDEGKPPGEDGWWVQHAELSVENAPHRTPESIELQKARCDAWEYRQRIEAQWDGVSRGRSMPAFSDSHVIPVEDMPVEGLEEVRLHGDHGEGDGATVWYLSARTGQTIRAYDEYVSSDEHGHDPRAHARGILNMLAEWGVSPYGIDRIIGDTNSAGLYMAGAKYNDMLSRAVDTELRNRGMAPAHWQIEPAVKTKGAPKASVSGLNAQFRDGRWFVSERCKAFVKAGRHFTGKEEDLKHSVDAMRYGWMDRLLLPTALDDVPLLVL